MPSISDTLYIASQIENALFASSLKKVTATEKQACINREQRNFKNSRRKSLTKAEEATPNEILENTEKILSEHVDLRV
ncbi:MAG: hypothetical protein AB7I18_04360 [Candidatus Berkiella sp.]